MKARRLARPETLMVYGQSGVGKTSIANFLARMMYEDYGLTTRVVSADLGGWGPIEREGLISSGIADAFSLTGRIDLLSDTRKLCRGYWPEIVIEDQEFELPDGSTKTRKVKRRVLVNDPVKFSKVGLYFIDGCTGMSDSLMDFCVTTMPQGDGAIGPQDVSGRYTTEDGESIGGNSRGHFNIVQMEMHRIFSALGNLKSPVRMVCWTGMVGKGKMKRTGETCYAPQLAGDAKNADVPSWVGDCFHLEEISEQMDENGNVLQEKEVRAYYVNHPDKETGVNYLCKSRVGPSDVIKLRADYPGGYIPLGLEVGSNIDQYFKWLRGIEDKNQSKMEAWKLDADNKRVLKWL